MPVRLKLIISGFPSFFVTFPIIFIIFNKKVFINNEIIYSRPTNGMVCRRIKMSFLWELIAHQSIRGHVQAETQFMQGLILRFAWSCVVLLVMLRFFFCAVAFWAMNALLHREEEATEHTTHQERGRIWTIRSP